LPAGAAAEPDSWEFWDNEFRIFHGADRVVLDATGKKIAEVRTGGVQLPEGSIDNDDPPRIDTYIYSDEGITSAQARELTAALLVAAAEIDAWTGLA
jgi:hypothetical protein